MASRAVCEEQYRMGAVKFNGEIGSGKGGARNSLQHVPITRWPHKIEPCGRVRYPEGHVTRLPVIHLAAQALDVLQCPSGGSGGRPRRWSECSDYPPETCCAVIAWIRQPTEVGLVD